MGMKQGTAADAAQDRQRGAMLDVHGVAGMLACSPQHVRRLADAGRMPYPKKLGALIRWSRAEIENWIANGCPAVRNITGGRR